jgi:hypothetical protein
MPKKKCKNPDFFETKVIVCDQSSAQQFRIKWMDAWGEASWTDDKELDKLIEQFEKPASSSRQTSFIYSHPADQSKASHISIYTAYRRAGCSN